MTAAARLQRFKQERRPIVALTAYDAPTAQMAEESGIDLLFVGDSVGTNVLGYASEREVTLADICHHLRAVRRGVTGALVLADLPYRTYVSVAEAVANGRTLVEAGADLVKLEGGAEQTANVLALCSAGVTVCAHIGFTPQTLMEPGKKGRVQGKLRADAERLLADARALEASGAAALVLELIPEALATLISRVVKIPTIGIGAGRGCDGQVLIVHDVLGLSPRSLKLARSYADGRRTALAALGRYAEDVREGRFPGEENAFAMDPAELPVAGPVS